MFSHYRVSMKSHRFASFWTEYSIKIGSASSNLDEEEIGLQFILVRPHERWRWLSNLTLFAAISIFVGCFLAAKNAYQSVWVTEPPTMRTSEIPSRSINLNSSNGKRDDVQQIITVAYPTPPSAYGEPVYSKTLLSSTFGNSFGKPVVGTFTMPSTEFNRVVLCLKTTVLGIQYDRLAHFYIGGAEIWRTSTIEPADDTVSSFYRKDVSSYVKLFQTGAPMIFQLDNNIESKINGAFQVELTADFYNTASTDPFTYSADSSDYDELTGKYSALSIHRPADVVHPLITTAAPNLPPLITYPLKNFSATFPLVPTNTTRLKLVIFTSGNNKEEFWYTNVLGEYVQALLSPGDPYPGHGPLRLVNVLFNGQQIATQTPEPIIFTGGISPSLWGNIVSTDAFDLPSIDIDVTGLLPFLWVNGELNERDLRIEVSSGLHELDDSQSNEIGHDWSTSASLLTYENLEVIHTSGNILNINSTLRGQISGNLAPSGELTLYQAVSGTYESQLISNITYLFKDGTVLSTKIGSYTSSEVGNVQTYNVSGGLETVHVGHSHKLVTIQDNSGPEKLKFIQRLNVTLKYPLVLSIVDNSTGKDDSSVTITHSKDTKVELNGNEILKSLNIQIATTIQGPKPNDIVLGLSDTRYGVSANFPQNSFQYLREASANTSTILSDQSYLDRGVTFLSTITSEAYSSALKTVISSFTSYLLRNSTSISVVRSIFNELDVNYDINSYT